MSERRSGASSSSVDPAPVTSARGGLSIQTKLPLLIGGLLLGVIALYTVASYRAVRDATLDVARQRLASLADQLAKSSEQSSKNELKVMHTLAEDSTVRAFFMVGGGRPMTAARAILQKGGTRPELTYRIDLFDASHAPLSDQPGVAAERHEELAGIFQNADAGPDYAAHGRLRVLNDTLVVPVIAAVRASDRTLGYIVRWRRFTATPQARDQIAGLLGANARLLITNDRGDVWTDFVGVADKPPAGVTLAPGKVVEFTPNSGTPVLATSRMVPGTPWMLVVEFSRQALMASADRFTRRMALIGVAVLFLGALVAWRLSRSITTPLSALTRAATSIAEGDLTQSVRTDGGDELGQLSRAFDVMVRRVAEARHGLEVEVRDRTAQLSERNEELEAFAHSISHDLRAPLRAMHGFSQALLEDSGPQLDATGTEYATRIVAGAKRMDSMIQDLLSYSRVSRADMALTPVNLGEVADGALQQLEADLASSGGSVTIARPLPAVLAHRATLEQVVANLLSNGLKFVAHGRAPVIEVRAERSNGTTRLWIVDNGIGIEPQHHARVFGVFERLHRVEEYPGTGIGLAIVRKGVERMGGRAGLESTFGQGSRFWIELQTVGEMS